MKTCYLVIALLSVVAALVMSAEQTQECRCDEGSKASLTVLKNSNLAKGVCGHLTLDSCNLTILCDSNSSLTLVSGESLELDCSRNVTTGLRASDNRSVDVSLECSHDSEAHLNEGKSNNHVLRIPHLCANDSNNASLTTTQTEPPKPTNEAGTTESTKNPATDAGTTNKPAVISDTTRSSNSSLDTTEVIPPIGNITTTEVIPSGNITTAEVIPSGNTTATTTQAPETTTGYAVSLRVCSGLVLMMLAVSSLL